MVEASWIIGMTLTVCSLFFYVFLMIVYFRKNAKYTLKNYLFRRLLYFGLAFFAFELLFFLLCRYTTDTLLISLTKKFELLSLVACFFLWTYYVILVVFEKKKRISKWIRKNRSSIDFYMLISFVTIVIVTLILPVYFQPESLREIEYLYGPSLLFDAIICCILSIVPIPLIIHNRDEMTSKRLLFTYYFYLLMMACTLFIHSHWPSVSMIAFPFTLCCFMIYNRLENPDILFVRKFKKNSDRIRELRENYSFIFNMSPELRDLLNEAAIQKENYLLDHKKPINRKKLDALLSDFIRGTEGKSTRKKNIDDDGIEILDFEDDGTEEMMVTKEIYSLQELQDVLKEDNLPKW